MDITYTKGTIKPTCDKYATLSLFNDSKLVYKASVPLNEIDVIIAMNKNIMHNENKK